MHSEITQILLRKFSYANTVHLQVQAADERGEDGQDQLAGHDTFGPLPAPAILGTDLLKYSCVGGLTKEAKTGKTADGIITAGLDASVTF